jgi:hypothetical protein
MQAFLEVIQPFWQQLQIALKALKNVSSILQIGFILPATFQNGC